MNAARQNRDLAFGVRRGFTLAEAIVTATALMVLSMLLVPATAGVARTSKEGKCLSNLARIGYANLIYATQDPADMALPIHSREFTDDRISQLDVGAYLWGGKSGRGHQGAVPGPEGDDGFLTSNFGTLAGSGPPTRPLNDIIYDQKFEDHRGPPFDPDGATEDTLLDLDVYRCPSDTGYTGIHFPQFRDEGYTSYDHFGTSYAANTFRTSYVGGGPVRSNSPYLHRLSELLSPATTLAFQENAGRFAWAAAPETCDFIQPGILGTARGWHGKDWSFNAAFLDGHADTIYMRGYDSVRIYSNATAEDEFLQEQHRCIIIRGEGWQKDTLPVAPVTTRFMWSGGGGRPSYEEGIE